MSEASDGAMALNTLLTKQGGVPRKPGTLGIQNTEKVGSTATDVKGRSDVAVAMGCWISSSTGSVVISATARESSTTTNECDQMK